MLASVGTDVPAGRGWVFEPKYDGIRILGFASGGKVTLLSRNGLDKTKQFPEVAESLAALHARAKRPFIVDGEIVAMQNGVPRRFQELQGRMHVRDSFAIETHREETPTSLIVFDILLDGKTSLLNEAWRVRRKRLTSLLKSPGRGSALTLSAVSDDGGALLREAHAHDWEGIIAKRDDATYEPGRRTKAWLKLKIERRQEFVVGGWTEPRNSREHIGALLLGVHNDQGKLVYAGHTGTGFNRKSLADMYQRLTRIERKTSPFSPAPKTNEAAHWTRPSVVVEIKFSEWTADGKLRHPVFLGIRDDKAAQNVVHEPESIARDTPRAARRARVRAETAVTVSDQLTAIEAAGGAGTVTLPNGKLEVSNLDKMFFPEVKRTKGDLLRYYAEVSPWLLPAIADRPLVMKRFPNGIKGKAFYQQKAPANPPENVRVVSISDDGMLTQDRLIGGDLATLLYIAQLGAISIDPWHSRTQSVPFADYAIIDLDPGPRATFQHVVEIALAVKDVLDELKLRAVPKTSGASGIHIVLPLPAEVPNDGARIIAELVATRVAERYPKRATIERWVKSRPAGAIYVDFLQNIRGKTVAGVYSVRAEPRATVSTPLAWGEVNEDLDPSEFTIDTVLPRIKAKGDLWAKGMKRPNNLDGVIGNG
jgi:bifunctional non-homologous end joining protein LigD